MTRVKRSCDSRNGGSPWGVGLKKGVAVESVDVKSNEAVVKVRKEGFRIISSLQPFSFLQVKLFSPSSSPPPSTPSPSWMSDPKNLKKVIQNIILNQSPVQSEAAQQNREKL